MGENIPLLREGLSIARNAWAVLARKKNNRAIVTYSVLTAACFFYIATSQPRFMNQEYESMGNFGLVKISQKVDFVDNFKQEELLISREKTEEEEGDDMMEMEEGLYEMVKGHPIEDMVPYIARYDKGIAGLIVGIAKKESNWGKRSPSKDGADCFNYWGYRGSGSNGVSMGYGCFATPKEGVEVIARRLTQLASQDINTPQEMVVWKCGSSCAGHPPENVRKWVSDVSIYFNRIYNKEV